MSVVVQGRIVLDSFVIQGNQVLGGLRGYFFFAEVGFALLNGCEDTIDLHVLDRRGRNFSLHD